MHSVDRDIAKWQPFSAVVPGRVMVNEVLKRKNKEVMPTLSEDQKEELQSNLLMFYNNQDKVNVRYYKAGRILNVSGFITNIDYFNHKITVNDDTLLSFSQIIAFFE